jgi:hypothetical protein
MNKKVEEALAILEILGFPRAQQNERTALCLLALLDLTPEKKWRQATEPLIGITPIMEWIYLNYQKKYAPNSRETIRRQSMHQFVDDGIALYNSDIPARAVNSPHAVYQIAPLALALLRTYGTRKWSANLKSYLALRKTLSERYAKERNLEKIPVRLANNKKFTLSPGHHSELIKAIIEDFASRFIPNGLLIYAGDTGDKWSYFDKKKLSGLGISIDSHGKMPDVIIYYPDKHWLILAEAVTSRGPVDGKRHEELRTLFKETTAGLVFLTAFPDRAMMARYLKEIAWETEVWAADSPSHLIHFNGVRFLGPYPKTNPLYCNIAFLKFTPLPTPASRASLMPPRSKSSSRAAQLLSSFAKNTLHRAHFTRTPNGRFVSPAAMV